MKTLRYIAAIVGMVVAVAGFATDPTATTYSFRQCEGSLTPYPSEVAAVAFPDSLVPVFINHVGRHGARYPASASNCLALRTALKRADSLGTITPLGRRLMALNDAVIAASDHRWGALDSLGMAEQQQIATRMFMNFAEVFANGATVQALSSYSPRSMMSMYAFTHQLDRMNNRLSFTTTTGRVNSALMRPFDTDAAYLDFRRSRQWEPPYNQYFSSKCPTTAIRRVLGENYPFGDDAAARELAITEYYVIAGLPAMGMPSAMETYFTIDEANALWSCFNLRQYLQRTATTVSTVPADIAAALVLNLIETTDNFIGNSGQGGVCAVLRFGHAETLMPLVSLLKLPGCNYLTNYFDTVAMHWRDFEIVPMAANLQFIVFRARQSGNYYVRVDLNERPLALRRGDDAIYFPWGELRRYMMDCVPLYAQ